MAETCKNCKIVPGPGYEVNGGRISLGEMATIELCSLHAQADEWRELAQDLVLDLLCAIQYISVQGVRFRERPNEGEHIEKARKMGLGTPDGK